jgi:hypothetical protein
MKDIFPALERRFKGNRRLTRLLRKLYHGFDGERVKSVLPFAEVTCNAVNHDSDTFDTQEPLYDLTFNLYTKREQARQIMDAIAEMRETFHLADVTSAAFDTIIMRETSTRGPVLDDAVYKAQMDFTHHISRKTGNPVQELRAG